MLAFTEDSSDVRLGSSLFPAMLASARGLLAAARRRPPLHFRPFGVRESESAMQFAASGKLPCICRPAGLPDEERRGQCRNCGHMVQPESFQTSDRHLTREEIREMVCQLQATGIRSSAYEVPDHVATLAEMNAFLVRERAKPRKQRRKKQRVDALLRAKMN